MRLDPIRSALAGAVVWAASGLAGLPLLPWLVLLGPLAVVPLGLALAATPDRNGRHPWPYRTAAALQLPAALLAAGAFLLPPGRDAGLLCVPWLVVTLLAAGFGVARRLPRSRARLEETCLDCGLVYLPVGAAWLIASRAGMQPLGFLEPIVLLTAAHFHFAGFAAPVVAGVAGRAADTSGLLYQAAARAVIAGPPLVAVGIAWSPPLELAASALLALGLLALAGVLVFGLREERWGVRAAMAASGLSLAVAMGFALTYAAGEFSGRALVPIPRMIVVHGFLNAVGFALVGLLGLAAAGYPSRAAPPGGRPG